MDSLLQKRASLFVWLFKKLLLIFSEIFYNNNTALGIAKNVKQTAQCIEKGISTIGKNKYMTLKSHKKRLESNYKGNNYIK